MQDRLLSAYHSQHPNQCFTVLLHWLMCCADARQVAVGLSQSASRSVFHCVAALVNVLCRCKTGCCGFHDCWRRVYGARTAGRWKRSTFHSWLCTGIGAGTSCLRTWLHLPGENYLPKFAWLQSPFLSGKCLCNKFYFQEQSKSLAVVMNMFVKICVFF